MIETELWSQAGHNSALITQMADGDGVIFEFSGELWYWRGPAPFHFVTVPEDECRQVKSVSAEVSYGWGVIPATIRIGATEWTTSLFPKDGRYLVPIKDSVRTAEDLEDGDHVTLRLTIGP